MKAPRWPLAFPAKSGILIRRLKNRTRHKGRIADFGFSYQVDVPASLGGQRKRRQFAGLDDAKAHATAVHEDAVKLGQRASELDASQREEAIKALDILAGTGIGLVEAAVCAKRHLKPEAGAITVRSLCDKLIEQKTADALRPRSLKDVKNRTQRFCAAFGTRKVHDITKDELAAWINAIKGAATTKRNWRLFTVSLFRFAVQSGHRADNPALTIRTARVHWKAPEILTPAQASNLLATAKDTHPPMLPLITLGLYCGLRTTELSRLDWSAVNLEERRVSIGQDIAKKRKTRSVEIPENAVAFLMLHPNRKGSVAPPRMDKKFRELVIEAGFVDKAGSSTWGSNHRNAMRHSFASYLYAQTDNSALVASRLGHAESDVELFDHYRACASKRDAEAYFSLRPDRVSLREDPARMIVGA